MWSKEMKYFPTESIENSDKKSLHIYIYIYIGGLGWVIVADTFAHASTQTHENINLSPIHIWVGSGWLDQSTQVASLVILGNREIDNAESTDNTKVGPK